MTTRYDTLSSMLVHAAGSASPHVQTMKNTVEDSPWHREASVWVHTEMVVTEFLKIWDESGRDKNDWVMFRAGIAALFHDFGKPDAEEERTSAEGKTYRRYAGHEAISATEFRVLATSGKWEETFGVTCPLEATDLFVIAYMIQHHLPYSYKDVLRNNVVQTAWFFNEHDLFPFFSLLRADARGRISDGHEEKLANVEAWIATAESEFTEPPMYWPGGGKYAYVLIGPSGAGKSTYISSRFSSESEVFSMDALRLEHYADDTIADPVKHYTAAFQAACNDPVGFKQKVTARVHEVCRSDARLIISDNTNMSKKARREFIAAAKQAGRVVIGVCFVSISIDELLRRGRERGNRGIPEGVLINMYRSLYLPGFDEVDVIHVV